MSIAAELWLRDAIDTVEEVFTHAARNFTLRLAEKLAQYICSLTRRAESLATPETECLLYATYWFRPILSELIGAAKESADVNRERAPSGPVKVVVTNRPHRRRNNGVDLVSGVSALLAWFPASWASKIAPCFIGEEGGSIQIPQEVASLKELQVGMTTFATAVVPLAKSAGGNESCRATLVPELVPVTNTACSSPGTIRE